MKTDKKKLLNIISFVAILGGVVVNAVTTMVEREQMKEEIKEEVSRQLSEKNEED